MDSEFKLHRSALAIIFNLFDINKDLVIGIARLVTDQINSVYFTCIFLFDFQQSQVSRIRLVLLGSMLRKLAPETF